MSLNTSMVIQGVANNFYSVDIVLLQISSDLFMYYFIYLSFLCQLKVKEILTRLQNISSEILKTQ